MNQQIQYLPLQQLQVSKLNVRKHAIEQGLEVLAASIKAQGVLVPLIVRRVVADEGAQRFEILAGQRRYRACLTLAKAGVDEPLPCIVVEPGDDASALAISLAENLTQLPMNPMEQYDAFAALLKLKMPIASIATRYGVTERIVQQRLALAKLIPALKQEIQKGDLGLQEIQILTMATASQQREWLALYQEQSYQAPRGHLLREWLCGGGAIETGVALFPLEQYQGPFVTDLFGDKTYFGDSAAFWTLQTAAIEQKKAAIEKSGWSNVVVWQTNQYFSHWNYEVLTKTQGGWVFILPKANGEVEILKGFIPKGVLQKAQAAAQKDGVEPRKAHLVDAALSAQETPKQRRGELTAALTAYLNLHKQAAVRQHLSQQPGLALRVAVAALIGGIDTWSVRPDVQVGVGQSVRHSVQQSAAQQAYERQYQNVAQQVLGTVQDQEDYNNWVGRHHRPEQMAATLAHLIQQSDEAVFQLLAVLTAETLPAGSGLVEVLGRSLDIDLRHGWRLDQTFLDLLIDKDALLEIAKELDLSPGKAPTCAALRAMIHRKIQGEGCKAIEDWLPGYLEFPPRGYTERFNAQTVTAYARLAGALGLPTPIEPLVMPDTSAFKKADGETAHESEVAEAFDHAA